MENKTNNTSYQELCKDIKPEFQPIFGTIWGFLKLSDISDVKFDGSSEQLRFTINKQLSIMIEKESLQMKITFKSFISQSFQFPLQTDQIINALLSFSAGIEEEPKKITTESLKSMGDDASMVVTKGDLLKLSGNAFDLGFSTAEEQMYSLRGYRHRYWVFPLGFVNQKKI